MKRKIAIWMHGGIGNGNFSQGYPMLEKIVDRLCDTYEIVVYSHTPPNVGYKHERIPLKFPPRTIASGKLRWLYLFWFFVADNRKRKFDSIIAFWGYPTGFFAAMIGKLFRIPSIISVLGADSSSIKSINYGIFHKRFPRFIATWSYQNCSTLLAISEFQANRLKSFGITRPIRVVSWGADATMYSFTEKKLNDVLQIIHVAHINPVKDQFTMIRAFSLIRKSRPAKLKIFGLDTMNGALHKFCHELGLDDDVEFHGVVPYYEMPAHFKEANVMLHTSLSEGQCMALTEAAACGVLMAGTRVGILHDLGDECGVAVDVGDHGGLTTKVLALLDNPVELRRRIENARKWSQYHDFNWTVQELSKLLDSSN